MIITKSYLFNSKQNWIVHDVVQFEKLYFFSNDINDFSPLLLINIDCEDFRILLRQFYKLLVQQRLFIDFQLLSPVVVNFIINGILIKLRASLRGQNIGVQIVL
mgnify:CR=1 FL=1